MSLNNLFENMNKMLAQISTDSIDNNTEAGADPAERLQSVCR